MPLRFRNIDANPDDPVEDWGFEGMLAALDRGYAADWRKLVAALAMNPALLPLFDEARAAAESNATVALIEAALHEATRTPEEEALDRLRDAFRGTGLTQAALAARLGTSRPRLNSYLTGRVTPAMDVLVAVERIAEERRAPARAHNLVLM